MYIQTFAIVFPLSFYPSLKHGVYTKFFLIKISPIFYTWEIELNFEHLDEDDFIWYLSTEQLQYAEDAHLPEV